MPERVVQTPKGLSIWSEAAGNPSDPPILLVNGATGQGIGWRRFADRLADEGRFVVLYDHRDTGLSSTVDFAASPYTLDDLAADAVAVLDGWGIDRAHVVGASMGGMIAQLLAIDHPSRVRTLTSLISSPTGGEASGAVHGEAWEGTGLPGPTEEFVAAYTKLLAKAPETREDWIELRVEMARIAGSGAGPFDEEWIREVAAAEYDRAADWEAANNHVLAVTASTSRLDRLGSVSCPTLVVHGTADPVLPLPHGEATAAAIPGARLLAIDGMGHELPEWTWPQLLEAVLKHTTD